jgi:TrmH family RNA methyltransferase
VSQTRRLPVSTANSAYQVIESLVTTRVKRHRSRTFVLEGVQPVTRALEHGWTFDAVLYQAGARLSDWATDVIRKSAVPLCYELTADLLKRLSLRDEGSELLAVVRMADDDLSRIGLQAPFTAIVMDRPGSPGNLGTIVRSADALGARAVVVSGHGVDPYDPGAIAASRGSLFALPVVTVPSHDAVLAWVDRVRATLGACTIVGADERATTALAECDLGGPLIAVFGNETHGLSRAWRAACDRVIRIPMEGSASSLNVGVAASIVLYEIARQRRQPDQPNQPDET